jgi:hypothetical protein
MLFDVFDFEKLKHAAIHAMIMLLAVTIQSQLMAHVTILGVRPMFVPALIVATGMLEGGYRGGLLGLFGGIFMDMAFHESTIMFTVLFPLIGVCSGFLAENYVNIRFFSYMFVVFVGLAVTAVVQLFGLLVFYNADAVDLLITAGLQVLWSMPAAAIIYLPYKALSKRIKPSRG